MAAVQSPTRINFGVGRAFVKPAGGAVYLPYAHCSEFNLDHKIDQKEIYDENGYPLAVFDAHRSLDLDIKHYELRLDVLANDLGQAAPVASTSAFSWDEPGSVAAATPFIVTLANGATLVAGTLELLVFVVNAGITYPVPYAIVAAGAEVAGKAASVSAAGVITFAAADAGLKVQATYQYGNVSGTEMSWTNQPQNSAASYAFLFAKRDKSPVDGSVGQLIIALNAVRFGGIKSAYKEGAETVYERTLKAFADPTGAIGNIQFVNTSTNNAP
ncbi:MAG: hypothetical protein ACYCUI_07105 [Vulcanimicrobiaceae bacterium]